MRATYTYTTQAEVRRAFWQSNPDLQREPGKTQNLYSADVRCAFVDFVDYLQKSGLISEALAARVTL